MQEAPEGCQYLGWAKAAVIWEVGPGCGNRRGISFFSGIHAPPIVEHQLLGVPRAPGLVFCLCQF